jgi:hypothetical protein
MTLPTGNRTTTRRAKASLSRRSCGVSGIKCGFLQHELVGARESIISEKLKKGPATGEPCHFHH